MKIFGIEIRRARKEPTLEEQFIQAANDMTAIWDKVRVAGTPVRPWIDWDEKEVCVVEAKYAPKRVD